MQQGDPRHVIPHWFGTCSRLGMEDIPPFPPFSGTPALTSLFLTVTPFSLWAISHIPRNIKYLLFPEIVPEVISLVIAE